MSKNTLKPCPCGATPKELTIIDDADHGFSFATCDSCSDWSVMVGDYSGYGRSDQYKAACDRWNKAMRKL